MSKGFGAGFEEKYRHLIEMTLVMFVIQEPLEMFPRTDMTMVKFLVFAKNFI